MAQSVAHLIGSEEVTGSIPVASFLQGENEIAESLENTEFLFLGFKNVKNEKTLIFQRFLVFSLEATPGFEPGIRVLQTRALPLGYVAIYGAKDEARTRDINLGKVALYQLSYFRIYFN